MKKKLSMLTNNKDREQMNAFLHVGILCLLPKIYIKKKKITHLPDVSCYCMLLMGQFLLFKWLISEGKILAQEDKRKV